jgi:hypothetical protein
MRNGREPMALRHGRAGARRAGPSGRTGRPCPGECPGPGRRRRTLCLRDGSSCRMTPRPRRWIARMIQGVVRGPYPEASMGKVSNE